MGVNYISGHDHFFIPLAKLGLSLVSDFRLEAEEGSKSFQKEIDEWVRSQPEKQVPELHPTVINFRNGGRLLICAWSTIY